MKKRSLLITPGFYYVVLFNLFVLLAGTHSSAQNLPLSDFVIYANPDTTSKGSVNSSDNGVEIHANSKILSGRVGSYYPIKTTGPVKIYGSIHSDGMITLASGNVIQGNITSSGNNCSNKDNAFAALNGFSLKGNLDINGNIFISKSDNSKVDGIVTHPFGTSYTGPLPSGGEVKGTPAIPILPPNAPITKFKPAGKTDIIQSQTITPGAYGAIKLNGNGTITFSGPGIYIFSSIANGGDINKFIFDFAGNEAGVFKLQVHGDVRLGKFQAILKNGGSASRVYAETHGNGKSCSFGDYAWTMDNSPQGSSEWKGTVYAPYGGISIGSNSGYSKVEGALWSRDKITVENGVEIKLATSQTCTPPDVDAGEDRVVGCTDSSTAILNGSSSTSGAQFSWQAIDSGFIVSGANSPTPTVSKGGNYVLTVSVAGGCKSTDTVFVTTSCIVPYYPPPDSGKTNDLIGSELNALYDNFGTVQDTAQNIFTLLNDSVIVDVIALEGKYNELLSLLQTSEYGLTDIVDNGPNSLIITGKYPVANLLKLDSLPQLINYCRPAFPPIPNSGIVNSAGDTALYSHFARDGFGVSGVGIKLGVISNSFNTIPGNPAQTDRDNGDLPDVEVLREYPYGRSTDEGRAMLQLAHDEAPGAQLVFRTGFVSAGDFAEGIKALRDNGCNIIVDDVTYITEPFFKDGVVAKAVNEVTASGVSYFTAAGNYGNKSYASAFHPVPAPTGFTGLAHDFGGGDIYQNISLPAGTYTIVLQWDDFIYSLNPASGGARNDLDFYLTDNSGNILFGFNRNNLGGDPVEVMPFTVTSNTTGNIMIIKNAGPDNDIDVKYLILRGEGLINEYNSGTSTIVGQANAEGAMTVGAVLYSNTPAYGVDPPTIASFSSIGGTPVNGIVRNKPDFTGPNGVNTTVYLGGVNIDGDLFPNFFGTSAAAPHVAGVAALIMEARQRFYSEQLSPQEVRTLLQTTAVDMNAPGFDYVSGYGFVQADSAIRSFASPKPFISDLILPDSTIIPGQQPFVLTVKGNYFSDDSKILFRGKPLETTVLSNSLATATIPEFDGNPPIQMYSQPISANKNDAGFSDSLFFFSPVKKSIIVTADNKVKRYGEKLPDFTVKILIDSIPLDSTNYTLKELGLDSIFYTTPATSLSNTGIYFIRPAIAPLDPNDSIDVVLLEKYKYKFNDGLLSINKLPLTITAKDTSLIYGDKIGSFNYQFNYPDSLIAKKDKAGFFDGLETGYRSELADEIALADSRALVNGRMLTNDDLKNLSFIASSRALVNSRPLVNSRALVNLTPHRPDTIFIVDLGVEAIFNYQEDSASAVLVNSRPLVNSRALVNSRPLVNGTATVNSRPLVNGSPLVNGNSVGDSTHSYVAAIIDEEDFEAPDDDTLSVFKPITLITGTTTGKFAVAPGAFLTENFDVSYKLGALNIKPHKLTVQANNGTIVYGNKPVFTSVIKGYQYQDDSSILAGQPSYTVLNSSNVPVLDSIIPAGTYKIVPGDLLFVGDTVNYKPKYIAGILVVKPATLQVKADDKFMYPFDKLPVFTSTITGFVGNDTATIISGPKYTLDPVCVGEPGVYSITPSDLKLKVQGNYSITYVPGKLYINPYKLFSQKIKISVSCVETVADNSGFKYISHFVYINNNKTPVFIPIGTDNNVKVTGAYNGAPPEAFMPGTGSFNVYSNELPVTWTVKSYQCLVKVTEKAVASIESPKCSGFALTTKSNELMDAKETGLTNDLRFNLYPNPAHDRITIRAANAVIDAKSMILFDATGKRHQVRIISRSNEDIVLNLSYLSTGVYMIRIKVNNDFQTFRILKE